MLTWSLQSYLFGVLFFFMDQSDVVTMTLNQEEVYQVSLREWSIGGS